MKASWISSSGITGRGGNRGVEEEGEVVEVRKHFARMRGERVGFGHEQERVREMDILSWLRKLHGLRFLGRNGRMRFQVALGSLGRHIAPFAFIGQKKSI